MNKPILLCCILLLAANLGAQYTYNGTDKHRFTTDYGYIDIGPFNSSFAHIYSDREKFIFNKPIWLQGGKFSSYASANFYLQTNGVNRMTILNSNGNVGIGTESPNSLLHVISQTGQTESLTKFQVSDASGDFLEITNTTGQPNQFIPAIKGYHESDNRYSLHLVGSTSDNNDNGNYALVNFDARRSNGPIYHRPLFVWTSYTTEFMTLLANGNLGIGTDSPDSKLTVKGKIHAEEVKIDLSVPGPDYVFEEGYQLMSLEDIQQFIKEHGHLPNIPSAKDMEENGVELGVMNMKLLEKIEELTLYTLMQNMEINELQKKNQELQTLSERVKKLESLSGKKN